MEILNISETLLITKNIVARREPSDPKYIEQKQPHVYFKDKKKCFITCWMGKQNFSIDIKMIYMCVQLYDGKNMVKHNDLRNQGFQATGTNNNKICTLYTYYIHRWDILAHL